MEQHALEDVDRCKDYGDNVAMSVLLDDAQSALMAQTDAPTQILKLQDDAKKEQDAIIKKMKYSCRSELTCLCLFSSRQACSWSSPVRKPILSKNPDFS
jgi:hypothetical protein